MPLGEQIQVDPNSVQGVLQQLLGRIDPEQREQALAKRDEAAQRYQGVLDEPLPDAGPIQRMVSDYLMRQGANPFNDWGNMAQAIGGESGRTQQVFANQLARREQAAKANLQMADKELAEADLMNKTVLGLGGKKGIGGQLTPEQLRNVYTAALNKNAQIAKDYAFDSAQERNEWIQERTNEDVQNYVQNFSTTGMSAYGMPMQAPQTVPQVPSLMQQPAVTQQIEPEFNLTIKPKPGTSPDLVDEQVQKAYELYKNPETRQQGMQQIEWLKQMYPADEKTTPKAPVSPPLKDPRDTAQAKGYGEKEGEGLFKERANLSDLHSKNVGVINQLNQMEAAYADPNIPEGALAPLIQQFRSGLKSIGIEVDKSVGDAQVFDALAKKLALSMKSSDGGNLLPGAMSNYEDQLLQSMSSSLSGTRDGNIKLMKLMKEVAKSNLRIAEEGSKLAAENKDRLPSSWFQRRERLGKEEIVRLKLVTKQILGANYGQ